MAHRRAPGFRPPLAARRGERRRVRRAPRTGTYGRFFGGPPPRAPVTAWQVNGGLTLALVAGSLDPQGRRADPGSGAGASFVRTTAIMTAPTSVQLHRARRRHHRHVGRGLLPAAVTPGCTSTGPRLRPDRDLAGQVELRAEPAGFCPVRLAVARPGQAHHRDRARRPECQGRRPVLPHDRVRRGPVGRRAVTVLTVFARSARIVCVAAVCLTCRDTVISLSHVRLTRHSTALRIAPD